MNSKNFKEFITNLPGMTQKILITIGNVIIAASQNAANLFWNKSVKAWSTVKKIYNNKSYRENISQLVNKSKGFLTKKREIKIPISLKGKLHEIVKPTKRSHLKKKTKIKWAPQFSATKKIKKKGRFGFAIKMFFLGVFFTFIFLFIPSHIYLWLQNIPNPDLLVTREVPQPTRILDRNDRLLYEVFLEKRFEPVTLEQIPQYVIDATIAVEDDDFYQHYGFDLKSMVRAAKATFLDDDLQGGSTITQQLVKNVLLTPERTVSRKIKELFLSVAVETQFTKKQILEMYLNNISYGGTAWGIQSASQKFFSKNVWELSLAEASLLAGLPSAPSAYSPLTGDDNVAKQRQKYVLDRMVDLGSITSQEAAQAYNQELVFAPQSDYIRAPHFVAYVLEDLENRYGKRYVEQGGLTVKTTLDLDLHDRVEEAVSAGVERYRNLLISNGASVVLDTRNAEILAYVGSVDYFEGDWGAYDVVSAYRQPGSSIKPLTYSLALEKGLTPASTIRDQPVSYRVPGQPSYTPKNYDGQYHGEVTLRQALANSYNIPAVRLANMLGPDNIVLLGQQFGLSNWQVDGSYGLAVTLGGKEVRLLDHTNFYASLARYGKYKEVSPYLSIKDDKGFEIYQDAREEKQVVSPETAYLIWHILSDNQARLPAFGVNNFLTIPGKSVAVKTGTTDQIRDNFTMGYTPSYAAGVWVGNNDNSPLHPTLASGLSGAAPIWNDVMAIVLENTGDEKMIQPENVFLKYDEECGRSEVFVKGTRIPQHLCDVDDEEDSDDD